MTTVVYIKSGTSFSIPIDWSPLNTIEAIGGGQDGALSNVGGKGAYYCSISNESNTPSASIAVQIGAGGSTGTDTRWKSSPTLLAPGGGSVTAAVGSTQSAGGIEGSSIDGPAGGGGAAGPNGVGRNGGAGSSSGGGGGGGAGRSGGTSSSNGVTSFGSTGGAGGTAGDGTAGGASGANGSHGSGGGGGDATQNGGNGGAGVGWIQTSNSEVAGSGGGGGGGENAGGNGGLYGGGGGGSLTTNGFGAQGIIVLSYEPAGVLLSTRRVRAAAIAAVFAWPAWDYSFVGGAQPYAPGNLVPSITDVQVSDPPFQTDGRSAVQTSVVVQAAQPDPWVYAFSGGSQPYAKRSLNPSTLAVQSDAPPIGWAQRLNAIVFATSAWAPPEWPFVWLGGNQPYEPNKLNPTVTSVVRDDPSFGAFNRSTLSVITASWQPPEWPYLYQGGRQPYVSRVLNPSITAVLVNNPPFRHAGRSPQTISEIWYWQPEPWPSVYTGGRGPYISKKLNPTTTGKVPEASQTIRNVIVRCTIVSG